jgi:hypothetical protein
MLRKVVPFLLCLLTAYTVSAADASLKTLGERSSFQRTGRYEEVERLCAAFQAQWQESVRCVEFGRTPEGRPMRALIVSTEGILDSATAKARRHPVVLMQGGIHAGEVDGKDAGFLALREMLEGRAAKGALERVTFVFIPVLNVDGHERFGRWNRPNQVGPEEMGWRTNAQNLNLNRDYTKADAPEMQAVLRFLSEWDPILYVDLHVTDGAKFEHDVAYLVTPTLEGDEALRKVGTALEDELLSRMTAAGSLPLDFYPSLVVDDDPQSGFAISVGPARFSQAYWGTRNRFGVLVETHSWKDYPARVRITRNTIIALMEMASVRGSEWLRIAAQADERARRIGGTNVALTYENTDHVRTIEFKGYAYTRAPSAISGALATTYDDRRPQIWRIPLKDEVRPLDTVMAPRGGYLIPAAHAGWMGEKLALHGIEFDKIGRAMPDIEVDAFRAEQAQVATSTFEGRTLLTLKGEWHKERRDVAPNALFVPIAQPKSQLVMTLLEPKDPDSFVRWGFFNSAFERKEYMEAYVAEEVAQEMLKKDPQLRREFERKLAEDPEFAKSPSARLDFFYRRHPSWDEQHNLYPVLRVDQVP